MLGFGLPEQTPTGAIESNFPIAKRTTVESVFEQPVVEFLTVTTYFELSTVGETDGAAAVEVNPGPVHEYVLAAFGC